MKDVSLNNHNVHVSPNDGVETHRPTEGASHDTTFAGSDVRQQLQVRTSHVFDKSKTKNSTAAGTAVFSAGSSVVSCDADAFQRQASFAAGAENDTNTALSPTADGADTRVEHHQLSDIAVVYGEQEGEVYYSPTSAVLAPPQGGSPDGAWSHRGVATKLLAGEVQHPVNPMLSVVIASKTAAIAAAAASAELSAIKTHIASPPPIAADAQAEPTSYSPRDADASLSAIQTAPPTRCMRGREDDTTPMSSVSDQMSLNLCPTMQQRREHSNTRPNVDEQVMRNDAPNRGDMIMVTTSPLSRRPLHVDPTNDDDMDEHIQQLYAAHEPGAERFESDRELLHAVEKKVSETIAKLDAGVDYEQTPLTEAIIRRHLEKQRRMEAEIAASEQHRTLGASQRILLTPEQRNLLAVAGYMDDFLPHLHNMGPKTWFPMGELRFDSDEDDELARAPSADDGSAGDDLTFERPPSMNAPGGIKPFRPAVPPPGRTALTPNPNLNPSSPPTAATGAAGPPSPPQNLQAMCRAMLWKGYRAGKPFAKCSIVIPLLLSIIVAAIFRFAGGPVCGGRCSCTVSEHALYVFTYGLAVRVLPTSVVFAYILHIMVFAHHRVLLEQGESGVANGAAGARVMMTLTSRRNRRRSSTNGTTLTKLAEGSGAPAKLRDDEKALRRDAIEALRSPSANRAVVVTSDQDCSVPWDVPSLKFCAQQRTFVAFTAVTTVLMSLTQFASAVGFVDLTIVPVEAAALFLPTVGFCFILRVPKAVWPMIALEGFPFVAYFAEPSLGMPRTVFQILWPFLVIVTERLFFYAFAAVSLPSLPIGARVAATTMITFTSHVLILTNSMFVPRETGPLIAIGMQVLLYELLLGTLVLDRIWMVIKAQWQFRVRGVKPQLPQLAASDLRCISIQTRWCSLLMAIFAVIPVRIWRVWPRAVYGGLSCNTGSIAEGQFYPESLAVVVGCFLIAAVITGLIRRCNGCLRAPLMVRGIGFPITIGLYLFSTATLGLAAGAYGVVWLGT
jgi:hypothetical protein